MVSKGLLGGAAAMLVPAAAASDVKITRRFMAVSPGCSRGFPRLSTAGQPATSQIWRDL